MNWISYAGKRIYIKEQYTYSEQKAVEVFFGFHFTKNVIKMTNNYGNIYDTIMYRTSLKITNNIFSIDIKYITILLIFILCILCKF